MARERVAFAAHRVDQPEAELGPQPARAHVNHVRARVKIGFIPATSFPAQPPTYAVTYAVQRFRALLSACSARPELPRPDGTAAWLLFYAL